MDQSGFENLLRNKMGLDAASIGSAAVERAVKTRMATCGFRQADEYWRHLLGSDGELQELIEAVVVSETWFFRDPQAFAAMVRLVTDQHRSSLRLLSLPCATGEEPYSMVMSLLDGGFLPQQLRVDAVDISTRALAIASRGVYGSNSFRGTNLAFRDQYFRPTANGYALAEGLRSQVTFHQKNLLGSDFDLQKESYDVIFCRNLLIYFDRPTQEQVMKALGGLLAPNGLLFVGSAETFLASGSGFTSVNEAMSFAFRKTSAKSADPVVRLREPRKLAKRPVLPPQFKPAPNLAAVPVPPSLAISVPPSLTVPARDRGIARRLADSGRLRKAAEWCNADLKERGASGETYCILGLVHDAAGDRERAGACYQKAIYLQPDHVEALTHLALMKEAQGDLGLPDGCTNAPAE